MSACRPDPRVGASDLNGGREGYATVMGALRPGRTKVLLVASAALAGLLLGVRPGAASCARPWIDIQPGHEFGGGGQAVTIVGHGWMSCSDGGGVGCTYRPPPEKSFKDIKVQIVGPGGEPVNGASVDANSNGAFSLTLALPTTGFSAAPPGRYEALPVGGGVRAEASFVLPITPSPGP